MNTRAAVALLAAAVLTLGACAGTSGGADRRLTVVSPPADLAVAIRARLGRDFQLGSYPESAKTLDDIYRYLATDKSVSWLLDGWEHVYATELVVEHRGESGPLYVYGSNREFSGNLVYAVSFPNPVYQRQIYSGSKRVRK